MTGQTLLLWVHAIRARCSAIRALSQSRFTASSDTVLH